MARTAESQSANSEFESPIRYFIRFLFSLSVFIKDTNSNFKIWYDDFVSCKYLGRVAERPNAGDCKSPDYVHAGSNPAPPIKTFDITVLIEECPLASRY